MLSKKRRIGKFLLKDSLKGSKNFHSQFFLAKISKTSNTFPAKAACIVSKSVAKGAVERNKIKRRCRVALASTLPEVQDGFMIVLYAKQNLKNKKPAEISKELLNILLNAGVHKRKS